MRYRPQSKALSFEDKRVKKVKKKIQTFSSKFVRETSISGWYRNSEEFRNCYLFFRKFNWPNLPWCVNQSRDRRIACERAILLVAPKNEKVNITNNILLSRMPGETITYESCWIFKLSIHQVCLCYSQVLLILTTYQ